MSCDRRINRGSLDGRMAALDLQKVTCSGFPLDKVPLHYFISDPDWCPLVHFDCKLDDVSPFSFALHADGACLGNGTAAARASVGVYGTPDAWYNEGSLLPRHLPQTNQSAEIYSAIAAIKVARGIQKEHKPGLGKCGCEMVLILLMDSKYVVDAMTQWIRKWRANGFRNARGAPVVNAEAFMRLDHDIRQAYDERFIVVRFRHVPREFNSGADMMANRAFRVNRFLNLSPADSSSNFADSDSYADVFSGLAISAISV